MEPDTATIATLEQLLYHESNRFLAAEIQLSHHLGSWGNQAASLQLKAVLQKYADFVKQHIGKLEIFLQEGKNNLSDTEDPVIHAFLKEAERKMSLCTDAEVKDACLLAAVQSLNHYKICFYGTSTAFAGELGSANAAAVFREMEINEKHIDDRLSQLAEHEVNKKARTPVVISR